MHTSVVGNHTFTIQGQRKGHWDNAALFQDNMYLIFIHQTRTRLRAVWRRKEEKGPSTSCKSLWPAQLQTTALNWCYITPVAGLYNTSLWQQFFGCMKKNRPEMKDGSWRKKLQNIIWKACSTHSQQYPFANPWRWEFRSSWSSKPSACGWDSPVPLPSWGGTQTPSETQIADL